ncbi:MAG: response regulator transcription factor [Planctomycetales bacterium]|nr:response regulator transcription factor [Planctomycetales bacterium]
MSISTLIADDHEVVRRGFAYLFSGNDIHIIAEAATGKEALDHLSRIRPDVVILDVRMVDCDGLAALETIRDRYADLPVLMISGNDNPTYIARAFALGANGFLSKRAPGEQIVAAVRKVAAGEKAWAPEDMRRLTGALSTPRLDADVEVSLTRREGEVLRQLAFGLTNKEIAQTLGISYETVKEHVQHTLRKLAVTDRTQAAVWAVRKGLV